MTKLLHAPGDTLTEGFGPDVATPTLLVTMTREHNGIAFYVTDGVSRVAELCRTFTDRAHAIGYYRLLRDAATAGKRIYQIVAEAAALVEMMGIDNARTEQEIAEALNAEVDAHRAEVLAVHNAVVQTVAEVMAGTAQIGGWHGAREAARKTVQAAPRIIHPTRTRVHCKPLTGVELDLIRQHRDRVVTTRPGQSWTVLRAIERRGYGTPTYRPGTRIIASIRLNARGYALAGQQGGVAA
jgi:hypothetical protein